MYKSTRASVATFFLYVSLLFPIFSHAQTSATFPANDGESLHYSANVEMGKAAISGICILANNNGAVNGSLFNEFGITIIGFTYDCVREKVKIKDVASKLNKWYIKRVLRNDLRCLMQTLQKGETSFSDTKHGITITLTPIKADNNQENDTSEQSL